MKRTSDSPLQPPRWTAGLLLFALPCGPMRDAILGDLHEEFARDVVERGARRARVRHVLRATGITMHALSDSAICRGWVSTDPPASGHSTATAPSGRATAASSDAMAGHARGLAGYVGLAALAIGVLAVGIVVNTMLFSAAQSRGPHGSSAAGGVALLVACVAIGAVIICAGPRWRRRRLRGA